MGRATNVGARAAARAWGLLVPLPCLIQLLVDNFRLGTAEAAARVAAAGRQCVKSWEGRGNSSRLQPWLRYSAMDVARPTKCTIRTSSKLHCSGPEVPPSLVLPPRCRPAVAVNRLPASHPAAAGRLLQADDVTVRSVEGEQRLSCAPFGQHMRAAAACCRDR